MSGMITATRCEVRVRRLRATPSGRYPSARMASSTRSRVDPATGRFPDRTWDTVVLLTCARLATSAMVTRVLDANRFTTAKRVVAMLSGVKERPPGLAPRHPFDKSDPLVRCSALRANRFARTAPGWLQRGRSRRDSQRCLNPSCADEDRREPGEHSNRHVAGRPYGRRRCGRGGDRYG